MTASQLLKIKEYQREYFTLFGEKLIIDIVEMQGVDPVYNEQVIEQALLDCVQNAKADINVILDKKVRLHAAGYYKERQAIIKFSKIVITNKLSVTQAAMLVNRDRSCLYHYAGKR
jgi:hypothetical protein